MKLTAKMALATCLAMAALPAQAAYITYGFTTSGEGTSFNSTNPDPSTPVKLVNATFYFSFDTSLIGQNVDGSYELYGTVNGHADRTGLSIGTSYNDNSQEFIGGGSVCFDNVGGGFALSPGRITSTCQSSIVASGYGSTNGLFKYSGVVTGLIVGNGPGGLVPIIVNGVPEPSTWALMLAGFGMVSYAMRRRKAAFA